MIRLIALYGIVAGLIVAAPMIWMMTVREELPGSVLVGYLTMIVALTAVFLGIKHYRDKVLGGVIRFGPALVVGLGISALASTLYVIAWEISIAFSSVDFADTYSKAMIESARAKGASAAELQQVTAEAESFFRMYANPLYRMPITFIEMFPVGVLISLISAALLRNPRVLPARRTMMGS
ncbi:MAG: DUF4199 domain-containing protein [Gammaproteobacteria bacterium]|nr:DUF4199 domain-containing protein [Gammaproteobacteria bacterium]